MPKEEKSSKRKRVFEQHYYHGKLDLQVNLQTFSEFKTEEEGGHLLLCSDSMSLHLLSHRLLLCSDSMSRGPHIPGVDWIVRFDIPLETLQYILKVLGDVN
ncbi:hypothetical protein Bca4012_081726 [Brassica carinata]|uniref:Uncharacterized protein n=1 Tax=Brassica carinata TaxID=52824 RepID=A0A8X7TIY1_BRACI|nr:hypothetical protein Bca52824_096291 [Brassica carinata]